MDKSASSRQTAKSHKAQEGSHVHHRERLLPLRKKQGTPHHPDETPKTSSQDGSGAHPTGKLSSIHPPPHAHESSSASDLSTHFLSTYFREMSQLSTLSAEQELVQAKQFVDLEVSLWSQLLVFEPLFHELHLLLRTHFRADELKRWEKWADVPKHRSESVRSRHHGKDIPKEIRMLAEKIRERDIDRIWIGEAMSLLSAWKEHHQEETHGIFDAELATLDQTRHNVEIVKNDFVQSNLRLVVSLARRFYHGRMSLSDLIQEGNIGLIKAVERFDYKKGYRFSTYASWWIRHTISRALADKGRAVRVPVHMIDTYYRLSKSRTSLANRLGRQATDEELSADTGVSIERIEKMNGYLLEHSFSIDQSVSDDDKRQVVDLIEDDSKENQPMTQLIDKTVYHEVEEMFSTLAPIEADVLRQRFGLDSNDEEEQTLKDIGKKYKLSRERIRQIQEQALAKIRKALIRKDLI